VADAKSHTTRVVLDLTEEELIGLGYAIGAGLIVQVEGMDMPLVRRGVLSLAAKIHAANEAAALEASRAPRSSR
jgi:hypothetical protein